MQTITEQAGDAALCDQISRLAGKYLTFRLGEEEFGVEILKVREIIGLIDITPVPHVPDHIKGVINLRGKIIPVIELRRKFALESVGFTEETCVVVVDAEEGDGADQLQVGVIVDRVREVLDISAEQIEPAPKLGQDHHTHYILAMGKVAAGDGEKIVMLLDIDSVIGREELEAAAGAKHTGSAASEAA